MTKMYIAAAAIIIVGIVFIIPKQKEGEIRIGSISALTGVGVAVGEEERMGVQLAVDEINANGGIKGQTIKLISEDVSLDKIKVAATVAKKLIDIDKVVAIVGPQWDEPAEPILPIIEAAKVPMVGADNSDQLEKETNYDYFFSTWYDNRVGVRELLRYAQKKGYKNISIIRLVDAGFWKFTADTFKNEAKDYGVSIVEDIDLGNPLTLDFRTAIVKVKSKNPDAVFIVTSDYNQCVFLKQAKELGLNVPSLGTESSGDGTSLKNCPDLMENRYFSTPVKNEAQLVFEQKFEKRFGEKVKYPSSVTAYDAVYVIAKALEKTNLKGGADLQKAISVTNMKGSALNEIKFNQKGFLATPENAFEMKTVKGGVIVDIK